MKNRKMTIFASLASKNHFPLQARSKSVDIQTLFHPGFAVLGVVSPQTLGKTQKVTVVRGRRKANARQRPAGI